MKFIFFTIIVTITTFTVFAQADSTANYSESVPYQPTVFAEKKEDKKKDDKKKKNHDQRKEDPNITTNLNNFENKFEIPIYVFDKSNNPVVDLKKEDFTLLVDEKEQEIEKIEVEDRPMNIILLLDVSASSSYGKKDNLINFLVQASERFILKNKVKVVVFESNFKVLVDFTNDLELIRKSARKIEFGGGSSIYDNVAYFVLKTNELKIENSVILFMTDAVDTTSEKSDYQHSLIQAERSNVTFFSYYLDTYQFLKNPQLVFGNTNYPQQLKEEYEIGKKYLNDLASLSGGGVFNFKPLEKLEEDDFDFLAKIIKPQYFLNFKVTNTSNTTRRVQTKIRVNRPNLLIQTRGSRIISTK